MEIRVHKPTSVSSSMFAGLMSRMLKLWLLTPRFQTLMRRSSADRKVSPSLLGEIELMWYVCALANTFFTLKMPRIKESVDVEFQVHSTCNRHGTPHAWGP